MVAVVGCVEDGSDDDNDNYIDGARFSPSTGALHLSGKHRLLKLRLAPLRTLQRDLEMRIGIQAGADLSDARAGEASFEQAMLEDASLERAGLRYATLREAVLDGASLEGADLWGARLDGVKASRAVLRGARLHQPGDVHLGDPRRHPGKAPAAQFGGNLAEQRIDRRGTDGRQHLGDIGLGMGNERHGGQDPGSAAAAAISSAKRGSRRRPAARRHRPDSRA